MNYSVLHRLRDARAATVPDKEPGVLVQPGGKACEIKLQRWTDSYDWARRSYILDRRKFLLLPCKFQAYLPANNASYVMEAAVPSANLAEQTGLLVSRAPQHQSLPLTEQNRFASRPLHEY